MPDDEVIQEEDAAETQTSVSSSDVAECVSDSVGTAAAAAEQTPVAHYSEQDNT